MTVDTAPADVDPRRDVERLLRDLRAHRRGLSQREAGHRLVAWGPNELQAARGRRWPRELARQFTHPLALLLWLAAGLALVTGSPVLAVAIVVVIVVNALFAFSQEMQAERAIEALRTYLPARTTVCRDGRRNVVDVREIVPGDVLVVSEGDRIPADARLLTGSVEIDASALTGESLPVSRSAGASDLDTSYLDARDLVFSGTACIGGEAEALVFATGMRTELGRIAALTQRVGVDESPLEHQVRHVAWLITGVAVGVGLVFFVIGSTVAGLSMSDAAVFAVGLLVANVPEGLLPTITLALAVGVRVLARRGALVKRLSAVETLGSTTVICTDKTGTLTENRMRVSQIWTLDDGFELDASGDGVSGTLAGSCVPLLETIAACNVAALAPEPAGQPSGDPTEVALLVVAAGLGVDVDRERRESTRRKLFHFDPTLALMSTVDANESGLVLHTKGAPESVLARCARVLGRDGVARPLTIEDRARIGKAVDADASNGLRVLGVARRELDEVPTRREDAERELCFVGLVAMFDPPRAHVVEAVERCHAAGIRVMVVTGDHALTAAEIARRVGIHADAVITGRELDGMTDRDLDETLHRHREIVFARSSPEAKLRIAEALRAQGEIVAMTGDGVNDAPALRRSDIGIAMGLSGTDVAREAATMVLTDDDFATIVTAVEEGRRVYANVRKFIFYIFVHLTPELVPFLLFALSGGAIPLPLTVMAILAIDLGTETLPALALGREPAEPGIMARPPRRRGEGVIQPGMLVRAWLFLGAISAALAMGGFFFVLTRAGWHPGAAVGTGTRLHHAYLEATTMTFLGIVVCQIGTAFSARTDRVALRTIGFTSNRLLLWGVAFELAVAAAVTALPPFRTIFATALPDRTALLLLIPFPFIVWGADELRRAAVRRAQPSPAS